MGLDVGKLLGILEQQLGSGPPGQADLGPYYSGLRTQAGDQAHKLALSRAGARNIGTTSGLAGQLETEFLNNLLGPINIAEQAARLEQSQNAYSRWQSLLSLALGLSQFQEQQRQAQQAQSASAYGGSGSGGGGGSRGGGGGGGGIMGSPFLEAEKLRTGDPTGGQGYLRPGEDPSIFYDPSMDKSGRSLDSYVLHPEDIPGTGAWQMYHPQEYQDMLAEQQIQQQGGLW